MVTIRATDQIIEYGDSITALFQWPHATGGLFDQINAQFTQSSPSANVGTATGTGKVVVTGSVATVAVSPATPKVALDIMIPGSTATSGWTARDLLNALPASLASLPLPKIALLHIGINDSVNGGSLSSVDYTGVLDTIHAAAPSCQIIALNLMAHFEKWDSVTGWGPNADDASLADANSKIAAAVAARSSFVTLVDMRSALLAAEKINNTSPVVGTVVGQPDGVYLFQDTQGVHPTTLLKLLMAQETMKVIQVVP